jgi:uncharacterized membrane protein
MLEMIAVTFDGAHAAERQLSDLRDARKDEWLSEVSVLEHDSDGRYSVKAKNPSVDKSHAGKGAAIGGLTGLFIGAIGGPFGLLLWGSLGALTGSAVGVGHESAFKPMVDELKARLAPDASMLVLVGETPALDGLQSAIDPPPNRVIRQALTSDQARELSEVRTPAS